MTDPRRPEPNEVSPTDPTVVQRRPEVSSTDPTVVQRRSEVSPTDPTVVQEVSIQAARARRQAGLPNDPTIVARVRLPGPDDETTVVPTNRQDDPTMHVPANDPTVIVQYTHPDDPTVAVRSQVGSGDPTVAVPGQVGSNGPTVSSQVGSGDATVAFPGQVGADGPTVSSQVGSDEATVVGSSQVGGGEATGGVPVEVGADDAAVVVATSGGGVSAPRPPQVVAAAPGVVGVPVVRPPVVDSWHPATVGGSPVPSVEVREVGRGDLLARLGELTEIRVRQPERIAEAWQRRRTRELVGTDGRLLIVAADHPARGALGVRDDHFAMGSRPGLIERLVTALERPGVDGVLATPDVLEDLLLLGALEGKVVIGSMNRGGLQGASFELDDRFTAYGSAAEIAARRLDGGKMLTRIDLADPGTVATLEASAKAVTELAEHKLMAMVEPFWSTRKADGRVTNVLDADSVIRSVHIAAGLGATSAYTWLKLPVVDNLERVMDATTLPTLLLGGDPTVDPEETYARWGKALTLPSVRGLVVGRALLFPPDGDVAYAVDQAAALVHGGAA